MNKICTAEKKHRSGTLGRQQPCCSIPTFSGKACTCLAAFDAHPIIIEMLICWKVAGIWVFVCDYRSLSSIVLVFPNWVEKPKLNEMNVGHTSDRWFGKEASCVFKQCLTTYLSPVQEWREVCKCCASTDDRNTHKS